MKTCGYCGNAKKGEIEKIPAPLLTPEAMDVLATDYVCKDIQACANRIDYGFFTGELLR